MNPDDLEVRTDWDSHERSVGPVKGYYLALCACETADGTGHYAGYYKICAERPASYWEAACVLKGCSGQPRRQPQQALLDAEDQARQDVRNLPVPEGLEAARDGRPLQFLELYLLGIRRPSRA